jgi:chemotaxis protein methyltransferase CheR
VTPADYDFLRRLLKERSGLVLGSDKQYLVESRLLPVSRRLGVAGLTGLMDRIRLPGNETAITEVVEAMATNESLFFRDRIPFDHFSDTIMPALLKARAQQRRIRIWSAAASTGQEPYSLAIALREMGPALAGWRVDILASDFALEVLEKAKAGIYSQFEVQRGLPIQMLVKYFTQVGEMWQIAPEVRAMVQFRPFNLLQDCAHLGLFDVVFCRNVLIYFDPQTKADVLNRISRVIVPDGYLVLGAAETVMGLTDRFRPIPDKRALYGPAPARPSAVIDFPRSVAAGARAR